MDDREKFNEISPPKKEDFYSHLNIEHITDADYAHAKRICKDLKKKFRVLSWFICSKKCNIVSWCIWKLSKYVS